MKKLKVKLMIVLALLGIWAMPVAPLLLVGCGGCAVLQKGADPVVVRAEQTYQGGDKLFRTFTTFEFNNRAYLRTVSGDIEKAANTIRIDGFNALETLQKATIAYKTHRTPDNKATIDTWVATIESFEKLVNDYFMQAKPKQ